jgi:ketopantoate hydroxymethyltransferase
MPTTVVDLRRSKDEGRPFAMLICYDYQCARIFDKAGIPVILIGDTLGIPTISIGGGPHCDGQVLVSTEMLGISDGPRPKFAKRYAQLREQIADAARTFADEVARGAYPDHEHSYDWAITGPTS